MTFNERCLTPFRIIAPFSFKCHHWEEFSNICLILSLKKHFVLNLFKTLLIWNWYYSIFELQKEVCHRPFWWDFDMRILHGDSGCHHKLCGHFGKRRWNLTTWKIERSKDPGRDSSIPWDILMYRDITNVWYIYGYSHFSSGISCFFILHKLFSPLSPK